MIISREEEMGFPDFTSHEEAKQFFIKRYGEENFTLHSAENQEGRMLYYYDLKEIQRVEI